MVLRWEGMRWSEMTSVRTKSRCNANPWLTEFGLSHGPGQVTNLGGKILITCYGVLTRWNVGPVLNYVRRWSQPGKT